jgi:5'-3' exonuclease
MGVKALVALLDSSNVRVNRGVSLNMLSPRLNKSEPHGMNPIDFITGQPATRVAIDVSGQIHKCMLRDPGTKKYITSMLNLLEKMYRNRIIPIFVFDGSPPKEKEYVLVERRRVKTKAHIELTKIEKRLATPEINTVPQQRRTELLVAATKLKQKTVSVRDEHINNVKTLFDIFGIKYIHMDMEADVVCSALVQHGLVDYCISEDTDLLAYGCPRVIRNFKFSDELVDLYCLNEILTDLGLSHAEFVDMCILLGCDYTQRIIGIKGHIAYDLIKKYRSIEAILENIEVINLEIQHTGRYIKLPSSFEYENARAVFKKTVALDVLENILSQPKPDVASAADILRYCYAECPGLNTMLINRKIMVITGTAKSQLIVHPEGVRLGDFRSSIGVYDKSAPHGMQECQTARKLEFSQSLD